MEFLGLITKFRNLAAWIKRFAAAQNAESDLRRLAVGGEVTVKVPEDLKLQFPTKGAGGKKRIGVAHIDFDRDEITFRRLPDKA